MPLDIPDEVDVETTTYNNFKGVDMTNDASNIWKYRMAEGLNMAPDEAGQPWKRTGWEIAITNAVFRTAFSDATGVAPTGISPQRVYYFELHGQDHMAYIADVTYTSGSSSVTLYGVVFIVRKESTSNTIEVIKTASSVSVSNVLKVDANRCFFFEGNGTAGFYMFKTALSTDTSINNLYIYTYEVTGQDAQGDDVWGFQTRLADIYVPTIIISRTPEGGDGTLLEGINLLTNYRGVKFYGDGSTRDYILPTTANTGTLSVQIMNTEGVWEDFPASVTDPETQVTTTNWTPKTESSNIVGVTFTTAPSASPINGEDNVLIEYESTGLGVTANRNEAEIVCSTEALLTSRKTRSRQVTSTYRYSGSPTYYLGSPSITTDYDPEGVGGHGYAFIITWTIYAYAPSASKTGTVTDDWSGWSETTYSPTGEAVGSGGLVGTENLQIFKKTASGWSQNPMTSGFSTSYDSYSNELEITLDDDYDGVGTTSTSSTSSSSSSGEYSESSDTGTTVYYRTVVFKSEYDFETAAEARQYANQCTFSGMLDYAKGGSTPLVSCAIYPTIAKYSYWSRNNQSSVVSSGTYTTVKTEYQYENVYTTYSYPVLAKTSTAIVESDEQNFGANANAFKACRRATLFGSGILNSVFLSASQEPAYTSRVWYSGVGDPTYFPDTNYIEVGSNDTNIMGMIRVGEYLGIIKQGTNLDATIYLAYPTSYDDNTTYAVKQSITGVGAISNGAFNIISDDALFLSKEGIMAVSPDDTERQVKNRSYFINKPLSEEQYLEKAVSFVYDGMYILCVPRFENNVWTGVCYVLDGSQKTSWANEKTNLQFEAYYWDNIPAKCFARYDDKLWFIDFKGNLCRFKEVEHSASYHDEYSSTNTKCAVPSGTTFGCEFNQTTYDAKTPVVTCFRYNGTNWKSYTATTASCSVDLDKFVPMISTAGTYQFTNSDGWKLNGTTVNLEDYGITYTGTPNSVTVTLSVSDEITLSQYGLTLTDGIPNVWDKIEIKDGVPIKARFATISDNDGATQYFKNMQKRGVVVSLLPKKETGATIYIKADEKDAVKTTVVKGQVTELPSDVFIKKKVKKYKRLQFVVENNNYDETFGVDSIVKTYSIGNFAKNRGTK